MSLVLVFFFFLQLGRGPKFKYRKTDTFTSINNL